MAVSSIFRADAPAMRAMSTFADIVLLNLLFIVTSLPLVTLGASLTALNDTAIKIVTNRYDSVPATYLRSWRSNLRQGSLIGAASLGLLVVLYAWYLVIDHLTVDSLIKLVLYVVLAVVAYRVVGTLLFVFPYQATFADPVRAVFDNARRMSARHPLATLLVLVTTVLPFVVGVYYPQVFVWGILWLAFGFAGIAVVNATVFARVFQRYGLPPRDQG